MENWCYEKSTLNIMAKHWKTGKPIPEDLLSKLHKSKTYGAATTLMN